MGHGGRRRGALLPTRILAVAHNRLRERLSGCLLEALLKEQVAAQWLPGQDSNREQLIQSQPCYRHTTRHLPILHYQMPRMARLLRLSTQPG